MALFHIFETCASVFSHLYVTWFSYMAFLTCSSLAASLLRSVVREGEQRFIWEQSDKCRESRTDRHCPREGSSQVWQLPVCLIGLNRSSYFPRRTTGFLLYPGTDEMFLGCDRFTCTSGSGFRHSLVPTTWPCHCGAWINGEWCEVCVGGGGGVQMTNTEPSGMLMWPVNINHSTSPWLLSSLQCYTTAYLSLTEPLHLVPFSTLCKSQSNRMLGFQSIS